ncbi:sel1 repeat family protein [Halioglobus maricola]|uniref:Sel1 repeat family protein n=1 Tax=Halioglobus maricola TaxID=2601894 RepID=A0A5P9NGV7_9GAMM|nr:sel1 repeat family protein [Halioglobus maricola]QFU74775.1 sel1 repeat family protein [Halioglobus maricola]
MKITTELSQGIRAFNKRHYEEAFRLLEPLAEAGELRAQLILARLYYAGNGVEKSDSRYHYWLQKSADSGDKSSRARVKKLHRQGKLS